MERLHYKNIGMDSSRWDAIELRGDDVIISTPAKCGTTWMQTCCALLLFQTPELPRPMAELSPWVDMLTWPIDELVALLDGQEHRRFLKTHTPLDGLPWDPRVTYVCVGRDPRDVAVSWDDHMANLDLANFFTARMAAVGIEDLTPDDMPTPPSEDPADRFWQWVDADPAETRDGLIGLMNMVHHVRTFWDRRDEPNVAMFHYADLQADLDGQMRRLAEVLGVDVPEDRWDELVRAATFEEMKQRADHLAPDTTHKIFQSNTGFFKAGGVDRWRSVVDESALPRYYERLEALAPDDLVAWLHGGWLKAS